MDGKALYLQLNNFEGVAFFDCCAIKYFEDMMFRAVDWGQLNFFSLVTLKSSTNFPYLFIIYD